MKLAIEKSIPRGFVGPVFAIEYLIPKQNTSNGASSERAVIGLFTSKIVLNISRTPHHLLLGVLLCCEYRNFGYASAYLIIQLKNVSQCTRRG